MKLRQMEYRASALPIEVRPMPAFKINAWLGWSNDVHNARIYARYIDAMDVEVVFRLWSGRSNGS